MAWIDSTYLTNAIGSGQVTALALSGSALTQAELGARATVVSAMVYAGYSDPGATLTADLTSTGFLQRLCLSVLLNERYKLYKGIAIPTGVQESISEGLRLLDAVYTKKLPIPGLTPSAANGYGGVRFSPSGDYADGARSSVFSRSKLSGF